MKPENRETYFEILNTARLLIDAESGVTSLEHQLHTRVYNSAFCSLLLTGLHCDYMEIGNKLVIYRRNEEYNCPANVVKQILRDTYEETLSVCLNAPVEKPDSCSFEDVFNVTADMDFDLDKYDFTLPEVKDAPVDVSLSSFEPEPSFRKEALLPYPTEPKEEKDVSIPLTAQLRRPSVFTDDDEEPVDSEGENRVIECFAPKKEPNPSLIRFARSDADDPIVISGERPEEALSASLPDGVEKKRFHAKWDLPEEESKPAMQPAEGSSKKRFSSLWPFGRKSKEETANAMSVFEHEEHNEPLPSRPSRRFQPKAPVACADPEPVILPVEEKPQTKLSLPSSAPLRDYSHDNGELFMHRHVVTLKKRLGSDTIGPYRFTFWPTSVPDDQNGAFAEMLVHVIDDTNKKEDLAVFDKQQHEKVFRFDGKELKVYGIWNNGSFESHISLCGQTASIFDLAEDVQEIKPQCLSDSFLSQFRFEKKGQPKLFIVPFSSSNRGERNIPIVGFAEVKGVRHALRRMEGNTLKYTYDGRLKIVTGHFDTGRFSFSVDSDVTRFSD